MNLRQLPLRRSYDSDHDDILSDFFLPALEASCKYDRLAGYFSSTALALAARGIVGLLRNNGSMRLVCGATLSREDLETIENASLDPMSCVERKFIDELSDYEDLCDEFTRDHLRALAWLISNNRLDIKIAVAKSGDFSELRSGGIFHQKVGILYDIDDNIVSFSGSDNETAGGWKNNIEEFKVFFSWDASVREYLNEDIKKFHKFWNNAGERVHTFNISDAIRQSLIRIAPSTESEVIAILESHYSQPKRRKKVQLWKHQVQAIDFWRSRNGIALFEMATGSGKTRTALACVAEYFQNNGKMAIISTPFHHLTTQWKDVYATSESTVPFIVADSSNSDWKTKLADKVIDLKSGALESLVIFTTHDTLCGQSFSRVISNFRGDIFFVGDEVHGLWSKKRKAFFECQRARFFAVPCVNSLAVNRGA